MAGVAIRSYGLRIGIRADDPAVFERLGDYLPPGWQTPAAPVVDEMDSFQRRGQAGAGGQPRFRLLWGLRTVARDGELDEVLRIFENHLQMYVAEHARKRVFIHAGVVGWRGKAILVPGRSFHGKTSLVAALVRAGATYYSDEFAVLDAQGRVHPYARPLAIRGDDPATSTRWPAEALGGRIGRRPLPVGLVVVTQYRRGARWRPRSLAPGPGALELLANTVAVRRQPEMTLATLDKVVRGAHIICSDRDEAGSIVASLLEAVPG